MNRYGIAAVVAAGLVSLAGAVPAPKALVVMLDGFRADAVENACAPNMQRLVAGKWQPGYSCAWSFTAKTVPDALATLRTARSWSGGSPQTRRRMQRFSCSTAPTTAGTVFSAVGAVGSIRTRPPT